MDCPICLDKPENPVTCNCGVSICKECAKQYLLKLTEHKPKCLNCKIEWGALFIIEKLGYQFYSLELMPILKKNFVKEEKNNLANTQKNINAKIDKLDIKIKLCFLLNNIEDIRCNYNDAIKNITTDLDNPEKNIDNILELLETSEQLHRSLSENIMKFINTNYERNSSKEKKSDLNLRCSNNNCRGFLEADYTCKLCRTITCKNCHLNVGISIGKHICKDEDIESIKSIQKESKNCPKCGVNIQKIHGCDHMYCILCRTFFDWVTLRIIKDQVSNPEYNDYLKKLGYAPRSRGDMVCGGFYIEEIEVILEEQYSLDQDQECIDTNKRLNDIYNYIQKLQRIIDERYSNNKIEKSKEKLRENYIKKIITENQWEIQLGKLYKKECFCTNISPILQELVDSIIYISRNITLAETLENNLKHLDSMYTLISEMYKDIEKLFKQFKYKVDKDIVSILE